jgi:DNA-binding NtrC family response regulator
LIYSDDERYLLSLRNQARLFARGDNLMPEPRSTVLIIDDDADLRWVVRQIGNQAGFDLAEAETAADGLDIVSKGVPPADAVLLDMHLPDKTGDEMQYRLRQLDQHLPVIVLTAYGSIAGACDAIRSGAFEYLTKPFRNDELVGTLLHAIAYRQAATELRAVGLGAALARTMGHGEAIRRLIHQLDAVVATDYSVLLSGETGAGKDVAAHALHEYGPRRTKPFVAVDCGALVDTLVDSELFGHERGAFTGAHERRRGRFELAAGGGTLFLDEVSNLSPLAQRALLRALEDRTVYRVGGTTPIRVDLRIIAATNEDLKERVAAGAFRADLYFRLAEYAVTIPPLRERVCDIESIARRFLAEAATGLGKPTPDIAPAALDLMGLHAWPGNARELRNVMRRMALMTCGAVTPRHLAGCLGEAGAVVASLASDVGPPPRGLMHYKIRELERGTILDALAQAGGNKAEAARLLGIDYKTLRIKLKSFSPLEMLAPAHA